MNKIAIIAIAVCAAILLCGLTVLSLSANDPLAMIGNAVEKSFTAAEKSELAKHYESVFNGGSIEVAGSAEKLTETTLGVGIDLDASAKLYFDLKNAKLAAAVNTTLDEEELVGVEIYGDESMIAVACDALFGGTAYGIDLEDIVKNFEDSVFGEDGIYSLGLDMETIETYLETVETSEKMTKDAEKVIEKLMKAVSKSVKEHAEIEKVKGTVRVSGEDVNTNDVIVTIDGEALAMIVTDVLEYVAEDKNLRNFIEDNAETILASVSGEVDMDADDMIDTFYDGLEEALDSIDDLEDEVEDAAIVFVANIGRSNGQLIGAEFEVEYDGETITEVSFVCGPNWKEITEISAKVETYGEKYTVSLEVEENTKETLEVVFKAKEGSETIVRADLAWEKKDGDFEISAENGGYVLFSLEGELVRSGKKSTLTLDTLRSGEAEIELGEIVLTVSESDKAPKINSYKDILTMSEDEIEELLTEIQESATELGGSFMGGGLGGDVEFDDSFGGSSDVEGPAMDTASPSEDYGW